MPRILEHIDEIARRLRRDVLFGGPDKSVYNAILSGSVKAEKEAVARCMETHRRAVEFLEREGILWIDCFGLEEPGLITRPWLGELFIDLQNDSQNEKYKKVCSFFEYEDGSSKFQHYHIFLLPYENAISNGERCARSSDKGDW